GCSSPVQQAPAVWYTCSLKHPLWPAPGGRTQSRAGTWQVFGPAFPWILEGLLRPKYFPIIESICFRRHNSISFHRMSLHFPFCYFNSDHYFLLRYRSPYFVHKNAIFPSKGSLPCAILTL